MKIDSDTPQEAAGNGLSSHALLAAIDDSFDREDIEERWRPHGYDIAAACRAASAYEEWAGELISFQDVDDAIRGMNITGGLFPERLEGFFKGWIRSASAQLPHEEGEINL
jgi:hypothetical protein